VLLAHSVVAAWDEVVTVATPRTIQGPCKAWPEDSGFIREVLDRIGDKWTVLVISTLGTDALRYSDLQVSVPGISQRMLTVTLKALERDGLVTRTAFPEVPPRVEYELTALGRSLLDAVMALAAWAAVNHESVAQNRRDHEATGVGRRRVAVEHETAGGTSLDVS
jgi:DNA-binding HxlR family transcriptional regulator